MVTGNLNSHNTFVNISILWFWIYYLIPKYVPRRTEQRRLSSFEWWEIICGTIAIHKTWSECRTTFVKSRFRMSKTFKFVKNCSIHESWRHAKIFLRRQICRVLEFFFESWKCGWHHINLKYIGDTELFESRVKSKEFKYRILITLLAAMERTNTFLSKIFENAISGDVRSWLLKRN